jgi:hypothetical protein
MNAAEEAEWALLHSTTRRQLARTLNKHLIPSLFECLLHPELAQKVYLIHKSFSTHSPQFRQRKCLPRHCNDFKQ